VTVAASPGRLYVVATPIGNLEDLSPRALATLREVALIACEDTRHTARLCTHFGVRTPRLSLHAHNERARVPSLVERLRAGESIALVSDAGSPLLSDPGAELVSAAVAAGIAVVPIPGPSAVTSALVASGLPALPFTFVGFLPRKGAGRREALARLATAPGAVVLFEAPGRVLATLRDLHGALGPRRFALARELTKRFEEIVRGRLGETEPAEPRGEVTLVIAPADVAPAEAAPVDVEALERELLRSGGRLADAARELARRAGIPRDEAYRRLLARRERG
jgi:16S rRNA (cytidine1402-2'-O)-methyltransferase